MPKVRSGGGSNLVMELPVLNREMNAQIKAAVRSQLGRGRLNTVQRTRVERMILAHLSGKTFPMINRAFEMASRNTMRDVAHNLRLSAAARTWKGTLVRSIQARKLAGKRYGVTMADYGWAVDNMVPHRVSIFQKAHGEKNQFRVKDWLKDKFRGTPTKRKRKQTTGARAAPKAQPFRSVRKRKTPLTKMAKTPFQKKVIRYPFKTLPVKPHPFIKRSVKVTRLGQAFADHFRRSLR